MAHPLSETAANARHDLGKAIALNLRWLPPGASDAELAEALRDDLFRTRQSRQGVEGAVALWARLRPGLAPLGDAPELAAADAAIAAIERLGPAVQAGGPRAALDEAAAAALAVSEALSRLAARLRE